MKTTILDNPPSEETALKMVEFFMRTLVPRVLEEERKVKEEKINKKGEKNERSIIHD
ncbi:hypothetical protein IIO_00483 [Bacillus cereus VD115]|nr:hypothetical protein IIO_00483 [Bacillus cereus VD115]